MDADRLFQVAQEPVGRPIASQLRSCTGFPYKYIIIKRTRSLETGKNIPILMHGFRLKGRLFPMNLLDFQENIIETLNDY